jgi:hypothetical protein
MCTFNQKYMCTYVHLQAVQWSHFLYLECIHIMNVFLQLFVWWYSWVTGFCMIFLIYVHAHDVLDYCDVRCSACLCVLPTLHIPTCLGVLPVPLSLLPVSSLPCIQDYRLYCLSMCVTVAASLLWLACFCTVSLSMGTDLLPKSWLPMSWLPMSWLPMSWLPMSWLPMSWLPKSWLPMSWLLMSWLLMSCYPRIFTADMSCIPVCPSWLCLVCVCSSSLFPCILHALPACVTCMHVLYRQMCDLSACTPSCMSYFLQSFCHPLVIQCLPVQLAQRSVSRFLREIYLQKFYRGYCWKIKASQQAKH